MALQLALVGDLSNQDPARLLKTIDAALAGTTLQGPVPVVIPPADYVIQLGDMSAAYDGMKARMTAGKVLGVPGNHDLQWDSLGQPRDWSRVLGGLVTVIGIDNSADTISPAGWALLGTPSTTPFTFICMHKPPSPIVFADGSESTHMMGEGAANADAQRLVAMLKSAAADVVCCGHYHGWTYQHAPYGSLIVDGRGGAAPNLAYTLITVQPEGWVLHDVPVG